MKERLHSWDNLKALCIICVLFGHLLSEMPFSPIGSLTLFGIYSWHVPLFMTIAGRFANFNWKRACCFLALFAIFRSWFIGVLGIYIFCIPLLQKIQKTSAKVYTTAGLCVLGILFGFVPLPTNLWYISKLVAFAPFFAFGYFRLYEYCKIKHKIITGITLALITFLIMPWFDTTLPFAMSGTYFSVTWLHRLVVYVLGISWTVWWINVIPNRKFRLFTTLGSLTLGVYLLHDPLVPEVTVLIKPLITATPAPTLTVLFVTVVWIAMLWYPAICLNQTLKFITQRRKHDTAIK